MNVYLIGTGLGTPESLTAEARAAIEASSLLIGAKRLLEPFAHKPCVCAVEPAKIMEAIGSEKNGPVSVLFSGDVGFYSGAKRLYPLLEAHDVTVLPGLSSLVCLCARLRTPWEDVFPVSAHGRRHNAVGEIQRHAKTFVLTGGETRGEHICRELARRGLGEIRVTVGERLGTPEERIVTGTAAELTAWQFDGLSVLLAENPNPVTPRSLSDEDFERGKVPMTKKEIRALAIAQLHLRSDHILWDVGAGTGSVSVEAAYAVSAGRVYAVERKEEALALLGRNVKKFGLPNIEIVPGEAPDALRDLPAPDRVFLGGTAGRMEGILRTALEKSPAARFVATAVTIETVSEAIRCFETLNLSSEAVQLAATRLRKVGSYHMADAQNPVWLIAGEAQP